MQLVTNIEPINLEKKELGSEVRKFLSSLEKGLVPLRDLVICYMVIGVSWFLSIWFKVWWVQVLSSLLVTSSLVGLVALIHEAFHDNLSSKAINDFLGKYLIGTTILTNYEQERGIHLAHHKYLGTKKDPTYDAYTCTTVDLWKSLFLRLAIIGTVSSFVSKRFSSQNGVDTTLSSRLSSGLAIFIFQAFILIFFLFTYPLAYLWDWLLPVILSSILSSIREFGEHKSFNKESTCCIVTTYASYLERLFVSGCNFNLHAAHHLFPAVPYRQLSKLTSLLDKYGWPETKIPIKSNKTYIKKLFVFPKVNY